MNLLIAAAIVYFTLPDGPAPSAFEGLGGKYEVKILRDDYGVPHIFGKTDPDTAFGLAYAHAEDDFATIRESLLQSRGELASYAGKEQAPIDFLAKLLKVKETVAKGYPQLPQEVRMLCNAYADGLNFYVAKHPDAIPRRYLPMTGQDVIAGFVFKGPFFYGFDNEVMRLFAEERKRPLSQKGDLEDTASAIEGWLRKEGVEVGSNAFAVAPSRTSDGSTYLAINSHQPWEGPVAWYEAHLVSEQGWNCIGGLFPGTPVILVGHNEHLGWAHTVNSPDLTDIYVLDVNPDNPNQYKFDGEWLDFEVRQVPIEVKLWGPLRWTVKREALWTVHGPAVRQSHGVYAIRYASMGDVRQVQQWYAMNKARDFEEWQTALRMRANASLNSVYADKQGNIYYLYTGKLPLRAEGYNWENYLPGNTSETLWNTFIEFDAMPQVFNPETGFIQNCNNSPFRTTSGAGNPDPALFSKTLGIEMHMSNRSLRALELFGADDSISWEEFHTYKFDDAYSVDSDEVKIWRHLCKAESDNVTTQEALKVWRDWDQRTDQENTSTALVVLTLRPGSNDDQRPLDEADTQALLKEMTWVAKLLQKTHGRIDVPWGEVNRMIRGDVNLPLDGGPDVLRAIYQTFKRGGEIVGMEDGQLEGRGGDCYFMLVRWDQEGKITSEAIHQYGAATIARESEHYDNQAPLFARKEMRESLLTESAVREHLSQEYKPGEE
ncbi:MAG: acylase [Planctomycetales bacterium]|nr:acylase [Planctomycetales bacterium]